LVKALEFGAIAAEVARRRQVWARGRHGVNRRRPRVVSAHPISPDAECTGCGQRSARIHSRYERQLQDLPAHGRCVRFRVQVRRFRCSNAACKRQIFGELLRPGVALKAARRTARLDGILHHLGVALGGRPAVRLARRVMLPGKCCPAALLALAD